LGCTPESPRITPARLSGLAYAKTRLGCALLDEARRDAVFNGAK
jgi:hypothetical protein